MEDRAQLLSSSLRALKSCLEQGIAALLHGLHQFESHEQLVGSWQDVFVDRVQGQVQQLLLSLLEEMHAWAGLQVVQGRGEGVGGWVGSFMGLGERAIAGTRGMA